MAEAHEARLTAAGNEMSASFLAAKKRSDETLAKLEENPGKFTMLTGDRPTGRLHLGHFFGSIKERVAMQNRGVNTNIIIADYQVITDRDTTEHIDDNVLNLVIDYMAAGIDPERTMIFTHSAIPAENQLMLPFLSLVTEAELHRNPTVKSEMESSGHALTGLLLTYPVHQACDILFCKANVVPIGKDNLPHVEITRTIARRFNERYAKKNPIFPEPAAILSDAPEIPGLDGRKMSKSYGNSIMLGATADGTTVQLAFDVTEAYTVRQTQQRAYHTTFVILIAIGAAVAWLTSYLLTRPLGTLSRASRELARGNLSYRAPVRSRDEVGQLASDFNRMAGQLEQNVNRIQESMALQERFMADFSHEMKTPMTSIIGYADLLRSQVLTPDEQMAAANYIFSEGKRLEALGLKLLDMLSLDRSKLQLVPASPADLVAGLLEHLKRVYAQKGIALQYRTAEGMCFLEPDLFKTLLVNLMDNARKALDNGGYIYVWQEMLPDGCRVRVLDNGRGIPPEALTHLTEAFYRVDKSRSRAQGGAGLGLSLCNEIVQLHGGTMQFESRVGNGTVVTVELKGGRI